MINIEFVQNWHKVHSLFSQNCQKLHPLFYRVTDSWFLIKMELNQNWHKYTDVDSPKFDTKKKEEDREPEAEEDEQIVFPPGKINTCCDNLMAMHQSTPLSPLPLTLISYTQPQHSPGNPATPNGCSTPKNNRTLTPQKPTQARRIQLHYCLLWTGNPPTPGRTQTTRKRSP